MTSAYLWKLDCISVNIDRFSSKCWYIVAETIFYKINNCFLLNFDDVIIAKKMGLKATCQNFLNLRVMLMEGEFRSHHESTWHCCLSSISLILALFSPKCWYVIAETMDCRKRAFCCMVRCWNHVEIFNWKLKLRLCQAFVSFASKVYAKYFGLLVKALASNYGDPSSIPSSQYILFLPFWFRFIFYFITGSLPLWAIWQGDHW